jgi:hypothetical protein
VRLGRGAAAHLYAIVGISSWFAFLVTIGEGVPLRALWILLPTTLVSLFAVISMFHGRWQQQSILGRLCAATLAVNVGTTAAYLFAFLGWFSGSVASRMGKKTAARGAHLLVATDADPKASDECVLLRRPRAMAWVASVASPAQQGRAGWAASVSAPTQCGK